MQIQSLLYHVGRIAHAWFLSGLGVAVILCTLMLAAPKYADLAWWMLLPFFVLAYLYGVPWLWRRYPGIARWKR